MHASIIKKRTDTPPYRSISRSSVALFTKYFCLIFPVGLGEAVVKLREPTARPEAGVDLVLTCDVDGNPESHHIEWFRNGVRIHRGSHVSFRIPHVTLFNVSTKDNGVYSCKVANDVAVVSSSTHFVLDLQGKRFNCRRRTKLTNRI